MKIWLGDPDKIKELYKTPVNRRLKYCIIGVTVVMMLLLISMIVILACNETISSETLLIMQGCTGVCAFISVILSAILLFRINKSYIDSWYKNADQK